MKKIIYVMALLGVWPVYAGSSDQLFKEVELESTVEQRVLNTLRDFDHDAIVNVDMKQKQIQLSMPSANLLSFAPVPATVESISLYIEIQTKLDPIPKDLDSIIRQKLQIGNADVVIKYIPTPLELLEKKTSLRNEEWANQKNHYLGMLQSLVPKEGLAWWSAVLAGALVAFAFGLAMLFRWAMRSASEPLRKSLEGAFQNQGALRAPPPRPALPDVVRSHASDAPLVSFDDQGFENFPLHSLEALFSDCYWCEEDAYASYLWSLLTPSVRLQLFQKGEVESDYFKFIQSVQPEKEAYHLHPTYLKPASILRLSQADLSLWIAKHPEAYGYLSPIRRKHLNLSLEQRLKMGKQAVVAEDALPLPPSKASKKRLLRVSDRIETLADTDEVFLWQNIEDISVDHIREVPSLIWMKKFSEAEIKEFLGQFSAIELGIGLVGPGEFRSWVLSHVPEKKRELIESYGEKQTATRASDEFEVIYHKLLEELEAIHGEKSGGKAA